MQDMCPQTSDDGSMHNTNLKAWQGYVEEATAFTGRSWANVPNYKRWMEEVGFEDVQERKFRWPSNQWSEDKKERLLGAWMQAQIENGLLEGVSTRLFCSRLGWSMERLTEFLAQMRRESRDSSIKTYSPT